MASSQVDTEEQAVSSSLPQHRRTLVAFRQNVQYRRQKILWLVYACMRAHNLSLSLSHKSQRLISGIVSQVLSGAVYLVCREGTGSLTGLGFIE